MDRERNLLFGVIAFQNGAVDADCLAETCAAWLSEPIQPLADLFVARGSMTVEQRTEVEKVVTRELVSHGGDPQTTLMATIDGRSLEALGKLGGAGATLVQQGTLGRPPGRDRQVPPATFAPGGAASKKASRPRTKAG